MAMLQKIGSLIVVSLLVVPASSNGQLTTTKKPPPISQGPGFKPAKPSISSTSQDVLQVRRLSATIDLQNQIPYAPYDSLSWKDSERRKQFLLTHIGPTYAKAKVCVYAYQAPTPKYANPAFYFQMPNQLVNNDPKANSHLVYSASFTEIHREATFSIDFGSFAPVSKRTLPRGPVGRPKPIASNNGENPGAFTPINTSKASAAKTQTDFMAYLIATEGYVRFFIQMEPEGGDSSTLAVVDYGEPAPVNGAAKLEVFDGTAKGEQAYDHWGIEKELWAPNSEVFRWTANIDTESMVTWEISEKPFPINPILHGNVLGWGQVSEIAKAGVPIQSGSKFVPIFAHVIGEPVDVDRTFYFRLVLYNADGTLACAPSNAVKFIQRKKVVKNEPPPPPTTWLEFSEEIVGYKSPYIGPTDPYQFKLTRKPDSDLKEWQKLTGNQNPGEGDEVYMPPGPPPEKKAWYEKVVDVINYFVAKIGQLAEAVQTVAYLLEQVFVQIPITIGNNIAKEAQLDKAAATIGLNHGFAAAGWVKGKADTAINMASHTDYYAACILDQAGVPAASWINARGKVQTAIYNAGHDARPTNPANFEKLLVPNPDYATHPAYVYLRIHATQKGDKSKPIVSSPGSYHLAAKGWYEDAGSIGGNKGWMELFDKTVSMPSMCDGMTMVVPIAMDYHWTHYNDKNWMWHYNQVTKVRWLIDYNEEKVVNGTASWGVN
jgi:hypothetical protein